MRPVKVLALCVLCVVLLCGRTAHAHTWVNDSTIALHDTIDFWMGQIGSQSSTHVDSLDDIWVDSTLRIGNLISSASNARDSARIVVGLRRPDSLDPAVTTKIAGKTLDSAIMSVMHKATVNSPGYLKSWAAVALDTNDFGMAIHPTRTYTEIDTFYADQDGDIVTWSRNTGASDYQAVDETTPNDFTDYLWSNSSGDESYVDLATDTSVMTVLDSARIIVKGRVSTGSGSTTVPYKIQIKYDTAGTDNILDTLSIAATGTWYTEVTRPIPGLLKRHLPQMEIGIKCISSPAATDSAVVTWLVLQAFYHHYPINYDAYQPHTTWHYWYGTHRGLNYSDTTPWNGWGLTNSADVSATVDIDTATIASSAGTHRVNVTQWVESIINHGPSYTALNYNGMVMALPQAEAATGTLIDSVYTTADGSTAWTASTGDRYACVDEAVEDNTDYVSITPSLRTNSFLFTADTSQWEIIDSVRIIGNFTHTTTGAKNVQIWWNGDQSGAPTNILDTAVSGTSGTYATKTTRYFSPTKSNLATMEVGIKNLAAATAGNTIRCDQIFVQVFGRRYDKYVTIGNVQPFAGYDSTWITCYYSQHGYIGSAAVADTTLCPSGFNAKGTSSTNAINSTVCVKVQAATTGTLYSLKFWPDFGGSGTSDKIMQLALYDSTRTTVIGSTDSTTWTGTTGSAVKDTFFTKTCNWGTPPTVTAGKTYWIAARFNNTSGSPSWTLVARVQASTNDSVYVKTATGAGGAWTNMASGSSLLVNFKMSAVMYVVCPTSNNHNLLPSTGVGVKDQDELPLPVYAAKGYRWPTISQ